MYGRPAGLATVVPAYLRYAGRLTKFRSIVEEFSSVLNSMSFHVYILYSKTLDRFYVGFTTNLTNRLAEHNAGESAYTSGGIPWKKYPIGHRLSRISDRVDHIRYRSAWRLLVTG